MKSSFFKCTFFDNEFTVPEKDVFEVVQTEVSADTTKQVGNNKTAFKKMDVVYECRWLKSGEFDKEKPTIIIPIKDNRSLMSITISNFIENDVQTLCNVIVVDDRSAEDIESLVVSNNFNYLRVDNEKGFNFSMLNNIAAKICSSLGNKEILLWNSDLWVPNQKALEKFISLHRSNNASVSGAKLLYPPQSMSLDGNTDSENITNNFPHMTDGRWRETVQFGGDAWVHTTVPGKLSCTPIHYKRFSDPSDPRVNCNRGSNFVTGALQMWSLDKFIELGGLNPSLAKNFQDVDICLRAVSQGCICFYFGKDIYFYHDESPSLIKEGKWDSQMMSDHILFGKIWNSKVYPIVF